MWQSIVSITYFVSQVEEYIEYMYYPDSSISVANAKQEYI
jgi:hypothetical protein